MAGHRFRDAPPEQGGVGLRHLRRRAVPRQADGGRRRGRHGARRGALPDALRHEGHAHPPARRAARVEDHAGARARQSEDRVRLERGRRRSPRRRVRDRRARARREDRRDPQPADRGPVRGDRPPAEHVARARADRARSGRLHPGRARHHAHLGRGRSSPAATRWIPSIARRSPRRAPAAWLRSTPSAGSPSTGSARGQHRWRSRRRRSSA